MPSWFCVRSCGNRSRHFRLRAQLTPGEYDIQDAVRQNKREQELCFSSMWSWEWGCLCVCVCVCGFDLESRRTAPSAYALPSRACNLPTRCTWGNSHEMLEVSAQRKDSRERDGSVVRQRMKTPIHQSGVVELEAGLVGKVQDGWSTPPLLQSPGCSKVMSAPRIVLTADRKGPNFVKTGCKSAPAGQCISTTQSKLFKSFTCEATLHFRRWLIRSVTRAPTAGADVRTGRHAAGSHEVRT